jgi:hypothetical protein
MLGVQAEQVNEERGFCKATAKCSQYSEVNTDLGFDFDFDGLGSRRE